MPEWKSMPMARAYFMMMTLIVTTCSNTCAVVIHAKLEGEHSELLQMIFKQMDALVSVEQHDSKTISQVDSEVGSTLLQVAPSVTLRGNITDHERRLTITFTVQASRNSHRANTIEDDDDDEEDDEWRSSTGVLTPIVDVVEPYLLSFAELVFNGVLSTVISNFLEGSNLVGDVRLV